MSSYFLVKISAGSDIALARQGLNGPDSTAVDVGAKVAEMGLDRLKSILLIGGLGPGYEQDAALKKLADQLKIAPLTARRYGEHAQTARQEGADGKSAAAYGAAAAITDTAIEKAFDGLNGIYGESIAQKLAEVFKKEFNTNNLKNKITKAVISDIGEGIVESPLSDIANQMLKSVYNDSGIGKNLSNTEWYRVAQNALINTIVGLFTGDTAFASFD